MNEPKSSGFDDPQEWNEDDLRTFLREVRSHIYSAYFVSLTLYQNHIDPGHAERLELIAMVESKMHEPKY